MRFASRRTYVPVRSRIKANKNRVSEPLALSVMAPYSGALLLTKALRMGRSALVYLTWKQKNADFEE